MKTFMFYWTKTHWIIKKIFAQLVWSIPNDHNKVFLTFDDGPTPDVTNWVLDQLKKYNAKATFFCIGNNIQKHSDIFQNTINQGHTIGNHTQNHLNGWNSSSKKYLDDAQTCFLSDAQHSNLFRPPYGKMTPRQVKKIRNMGYKIIMWDVLSADFDTSISTEKCLENVLANIESGSIVVFHDSQKAFKNLEFVLPRTLDFIAKKGWVCEAIAFKKI